MVDLCLQRGHANKSETTEQLSLALTKGKGWRKMRINTSDRNTVKGQSRCLNS